jgi:hypothetical protein
MTPEELQDYVVYSVQHDGYAYWGRMTDGNLGWCLVKPDAHGYPLSKTEADAVCIEMTQKYGGEYKIVPRAKSDVTCVKAV